MKMEESILPKCLLNRVLLGRTFFNSFGIIQIFIILFQSIDFKFTIGAVVLVDDATEMCCMGVVRVVAAGQRDLTNCCGNATYNEMTHACCDDGNLISTSAGGDLCCGGKSYDSERNICCGGRLHPRHLFNDCCGQVPFHDQTSACCDRQVIAKEDLNEDTECCGQKLFNPRVSLCCENQILPRVPHSLSCCGNTTYDKETSLCCENQVIPSDKDESCCGAKVIDFNSQVCCKGRIFPRTSSWTFCCGNQSYEKNSHICCRQTVLARLPGEERWMACCGATAYSLKRSFCCGETMFLLTENQTRQSCCTASGWQRSDIDFVEMPEDFEDDERSKKKSYEITRREF